MNHKQIKLRSLWLLVLLIIPAFACSTSIIKQPEAAVMNNAVHPTDSALPFPSSTPLITSTASPRVCEVTADVLNLRESPGIDAPVIAWLLKGDQLTILPGPTVESWWRVQIADHRIGWINSLYCQREST